MRCIGKGAESAVMFCGIMNLPPPPTKFTKFNNILLQAARETCEESMAEAVHEAVEENDGGRDIAVAVDGSWQKRGFSSKNGVVTVTSVDTEAMRNTKIQQYRWAKYYNKRRREGDVKVKDLVLVQTHPMSSASKRIVNQVRIYHPRERNEGVMETDGLDSEGSRAEQVETEGSKGLAREESSKEEQWRGKRMRSEGSIESSNNHERQHQSKRRPPVRRNWENAARLFH
ncbi:uncharacterized protein NPIL_190851 [Nephila pilipes]|uniref:Mutator-like transposase domain-containing protein n=2 Tax=Nephila pilipes TaxID=299642 RepID=A0A8X6QSV8_NEPPI|nr:uncharacterized protein NPIL_190851 [Nephila pilipes]